MSAARRRVLCRDASQTVLKEERLSVNTFGSKFV